MPSQVADPYASDGDDDVSGPLNEMQGYEQEDRQSRAPNRAGPSNTDDEYEFDSADTPEEFQVQAPAKREAAPRQQRRQERGGYQEAYKGAREDNDRLRREIDTLRQAPPAQGQDDGERAESKYKQNMDSARGERDSLLETYNRGMTAGSLTDADQTRMRGQAWELDQRIGKLNNDEWARQREPSQNQRRNDAMNAQLSARAPEIYANKVAHGLLMAKYAVLRGKGHRDSIETHDRACEEVRDEMGLRREEDRPEPTDRDRAQLSGIPRGGSRGGRRGRGRAPSYRMDKNDRKMADVSHGHIKDERERYQTWVNEVRPDIE